MFLAGRGPGWLLLFVFAACPLTGKPATATAPVLAGTFLRRNLRFTGAGYRAGDWVHVGQAKGGGKLDRHYNSALPVKDICRCPPPPLAPDPHHPARPAGSPDTYGCGIDLSWQP
jgi:hypothetical protein